MQSPIVHQPHDKPDYVRVRMENVGSRCIRRLGYNPETQQLVLHLRDSLPGLRTVYWPVPEDVYRQLLEAESMGRFLEERIRYTFDFSLVNEDALLDPDRDQGPASA